MPRVRHRDFSRGLWLTGPRDTMPAGTMRQAKGVRQLLTTSIRSRYGSRSIAPLTNVHSIFRFNDLRYFGVGTDFLVGKGTVGQQAAASSILTPFGAFKTTGSPLRFARGIPSPTIDRTRFPQGPEFMYVVGGGLTAAGVGVTDVNNMGVFKVSTNGNASPMGLPAPVAALVVTKIDANPYAAMIESFNLGDFLTDANLVVPGINISSVLRQEGSASTQVVVPANSVSAISKNVTTDLVNVTPQAVSSDEDWIQLWVLVDIPDNLNKIELIIDTTNPPQPAQSPIIGTKTGLVDIFSFQILVEDSVLSDTTTGVGDPDLESESVKEARQHPVKFAKQRLDQLKNIVPINTATVTTSELGATRLAKTGNTWTHVRIPKKNFTKAGKPDWSRVRRIRITISTNDKGPVQVYLDALQLHVGTGMSGRYKYAYCYKNSFTGTRSNPSPILDDKGNELAFIDGIQRDAVALANFVLPPELKHQSQIDTIEIFRTPGDGFVYLKSDEFLLASHPAGGGYTDVVADGPALQSRVASAFGSTINAPGRLTKYLESEELPFDNLRFPDTLRDICGPHFNRLFAIGGAPGDRGRLFFSPIGRLEVNEGYIDVSTDDEPLQRCLDWSDNIYCFSEAWLYEIRGSDIFVASKVFGVPGTRWPSTVVATPYGICYRASDGPRIFDGAGSRLLFPEAVLTVFRGESSVENGQTNGVISFNGLYACYKDDEYLISDGLTTTLAVNLRTGAWRNLGISAVALFVEPDTNQLLFAQPTRVLEMEVQGLVTDGGTPIPFVVEVPGTLVEDQSSRTKIVQRLYLDLWGGPVAVKIRYAVTGGVVTIDDALVTGSRQLVEYSLGIPSDVVSVEISGDLVSAIEIFGVEFDVHLPELPPGGVT